MRLAALGLLLVVAACPAAKRAPTAAPPVVQPSTPVVPSPPAPTLRLPRNFTPVEYAARLAIDPATTTFSGTIAITGTVTKRSELIWLHGSGLTIQKATTKAATLAVTPRGNDLLEIRAEPPLEPGTHVLAFEYTGKLGELETAGAFRQVVAGSTYVMTQLEALYARRVFPCLDEPDSKVPWQLTLDVPKGNRAFSNTLGTETTLPDGRLHYEFARTLPLPSYLIAFGVGPFDVVDGGASKRGIPVRIITQKGRGPDATYAAQATARILDLAEEWFGIPYPYEKLDLLTIPITVGFGAMENAGLITMSERLMLLDKPSWKRRRDFVAVTAHEIAHQWFGNYVTMVWWDDIWLNEGFASWVGRKLTGRFEPAWREELAELDTRTEALEADNLITARQVREPVVTVDDIDNAFDGITYTKGASVLDMFEAYVGADVFQRGVREYLKSRALGNATSNDFVAAISAVAKKDLVPGFATFLDQPGAPELELELACDASGPRIEFAQQRFVASGSAATAARRPWQVPVCVAYEQGGKRAEHCTELSTERGSIAMPGKACPRWIFANANGRGHYRVRYTPAQATTLRDEAWPLLSWTERRSLLFEVVSASRNRPRPILDRPTSKVPLTLVMSLVPRMLAGGDRFTIRDAIDVPLELDHLVADDQRAKFEGWLRATFGPGATKVGVQPKQSDDLDAERSRARLLEVVAWTGRDPELIAKAVELAQDWRDLSASIRETILMVAADASPDLHAKLIRDVKTETDRTRRGEMFAALAATRDAKRVEAALALLLDLAVDIRESQDMLYGLSTEATRKVAERFVRVNEKPLLARMPASSVSGGSAEVLVDLFTNGCDAATRDEAVAYVTQHLGPFAGGKRVVDQHVEKLDQCIATRALIEPELRGFLSGVKLAKPAKP